MCNTKNTFMTKEEAIKKGYLEDKIVYLKPLPRPGKMVRDKNHVGYFMWDGAVKHFCLPIDVNTGVLKNPFSSDEERKFFEEAMNADLNVFSSNSKFWKDFKVSIVKDAGFMENGVKFDLSVPIDNLKYKVLKLWAGEEVALSEEDAEANPFVRFILVEEGYKSKKQVSEADALVEIYTFYGSIKDSQRKCADFLSAYLLNKHSARMVPEDATLEWLNAQIKDAIDNDRAGVLDTIRDTNYDMKLFIARAVRIGAIQKYGVNSYSIPGMGVKYTLAEFVPYMKQLEDTTDDIYLKIKAQVDMASGNKKVHTTTTKKNE